MHSLCVNSLTMLIHFRAWWKKLIQALTMRWQWQVAMSKEMFAQAIFLLSPPFITSSFHLIGNILFGGEGGGEGIIPPWISLLLTRGPSKISTMWLEIPEVLFCTLPHTTITSKSPSCLLWLAERVVTGSLIGLKCQRCEISQSN